ncbi:MAG: hypothetical protein NZM12_00870 [Steroidobacteraceae bacterium]|nr:hypothetical protein [Steroidobacteraceae bacterium]MDW8260372.1 hypothetical protein [Gammaproteobacteria bacterium]
MLQILRLFWDILLLRKGPAEVPYAPALLGGVIGALLAGNFLLGRLLPAPAEPQNPLLLPVAVALALLAYRLLLGRFGVRERFVQTATAMMGVSLLLMPAEFLVAALASGAIALPAALRGAAVSFTFVALVAYDAYVNARILGAAIERPTALAIIIVVCVQLAVFIGALLITGERLPTATPASSS